MNECVHEFVAQLLLAPADCRVFLMQSQFVTALLLIYIIFEREIEANVGNSSSN